METTHIKTPLKINFREDDNFNQAMSVEYSPCNKKFIFHFSNELIPGVIDVTFNADEIKVIKDALEPFSTTRRFGNVDFQAITSENETSKFKAAKSNRGEPYRDVIEFSIEIGSYEESVHEHSSCGLIHSEILELYYFLDNIEIAGGGK